MAITAQITRSGMLAACSIAMVVQFGAYGFARIVIPELSRKIEEDRIPSAAMLAVIAVLSGTLAAASMTL